MEKEEIEERIKDLKAQLSDLIDKQSQANQQSQMINQQIIGMRHRIDELENERWKKVTKNEIPKTRKS